jgi:Tol biopolymer transport system component
MRRNGKEPSITTVNGGVVRGVGEFALSPNDRYVALAIEENDGQQDVWIVDLEKKITDRLTNHQANDYHPFWSADGQWVYFKSNRHDGQTELWRKRAHSFESNAEFVWSNDGQDFWPSSLSRDGSHMTYSVLNENWDLWTIRLDQEHPQKRILKGSSANEGWNAVSPDGKWFAYSSDFSSATPGRSELYVVPFENPDMPPDRITRDGGSVLAWSSNGDRLFYRHGDGHHQPIYSIDFNVENGVISMSEPQEFLAHTNSSFWWQVDSKGERVLLIEKEQEADDQENNGLDDDHNLVRVVSNFFTVLNEKAPPAKAK